jgi:hypothetical protein
MTPQITVGFKYESGTGLPGGSSSPISSDMRSSAPASRAAAPASQRASVGSPGRVGMVEGRIDAARSSGPAKRR